LDKKVSRDFTLDVLRALSCIMVFGVHLGQKVTIPGSLGVFFSKGSTGVGFFFILSGYLAYASLERLQSKYDSFVKTMVVFWIKKLLRILPLYFIVILFYMVFYYAIGGVPEDNTGLYWVRYLVFANSFVTSENPFWTNLGAVWSISCFVFFYLICPICYKFIRKSWSAWISVIVSYGLLKFIDARNIYNLPLRWLFYFLLGVLVYVACKENKEAFTVGVMFIVVLFCVLTDKGTSIIAPLLASVLILATRNSKNSSNLGIIEKSINYISMVSYSIYLIHVVVIKVLDYIEVFYGATYAIVLIVSTAVISVASYYLIEKRLGNVLMNATMGLIQ